MTENSVLSENFGKFTPTGCRVGCRDLTLDISNPEINQTFKAVNSHTPSAGIVRPH